MRLKSLNKTIKLLMWLWIVLSVLVIGDMAQAQVTTTTVTGTIKGLDNVTQTSGKVVFSLKQSIDTTISGTARFLPTAVTCKITATGIKANDGVSACLIMKNTSLTPAGTYYQTDICPQNACTSKLNFYAINDTVDLSTVAPVPGSSPVFSLVDLFSNQTIAGNKTFTGNNVHTGNETFTSATVNGTINAGGGCAGNGITDDTSCLNGNIVLAGATGCIRFPAKTFATTGTIHITTQCVKSDGAIILYSGTGSAVDVTITYPEQNGCNINFPAILRPSRLWSGGSPSTDSGISFLDANACEFHIPRVQHFTNGLNFSPSGFGVARNNFFLGDLNDNMRQVVFAPTTTNGFVNQNIFHGGYWANDATLGWAVPGTRNILMSASTDQVTSNLFIGPDLEGQVAEFMVESWGAYNRITMGEWENPISRTMTDVTTTSGSPTITLTTSDVSAGKGFNANADVGQTVASSLFAGGTTILSVSSTTVATASTNATGSATANGTATISSAPRVAYRSSGGNTALQNSIEGGFPASNIVVTKDVGVVSANPLISAGNSASRYSIADGGNAVVGRGAPVTFSGITLAYGKGTPQWSVVPTSAASGDNQTEGGLGACVGDALNFCAKLYTDSANTHFGIGANGNGLGFIRADFIGNTEYYVYNNNTQATTLGASGGTVTSNGNFSATGTVNTGTGGTSTIDRTRYSKATAQTSGNLALSAGWGNTATISSVLGTDNAVAIIVSSSGTGQAASPTITVTYADGSWTSSPVCVAVPASGSGANATGVFINSVNTTQVVIGFAGFTPAAGTTYGVNILCGGR